MSHPYDSPIERGFWEVSFEAIIGGDKTVTVHVEERARKEGGIWLSPEEESVLDTFRPHFKQFRQNFKRWRRIFAKYFYPDPKFWLWLRFLSNCSKLSSNFEHIHAQ